MSAFDPQAATAAYMSTLDAAELELARDYTTGNHWLILGGLVVAALVAWIVVRSRVLDRIDTKLSRRGLVLTTFLIAAAYLFLSGVLTLPWSIYTDWWREAQYGRTSQPLGDFLSQGGISLVITSLLGGLLVVGIYALIRKAGRFWWLWSGGLVAAFAAFMLLLSPVLIEPLFNDFQPIPEGEVRDGVLALAEEAGVPADRVFMYDGSRQSNNFTANVAGVGSSARIAISDVALDEASLDEVLAVTGHEIGHYTLGHVWRLLAVAGGLALLAFWLTDRLYPRVARWFGTDAALSDPRGLPVFVFLIGLVFTLAQPVSNAVTRMGEREADAYSLRTANLPDGLASALIKTAEYRYPLAGPLEEALFYTHPSVERRIRSAMEWKAANMPASE